MASEHDDVVYTHIDDEESSETDEDHEENDDELEDPEEEDLNSPSTSSPMAVSAANVTKTATPATPANASTSVTVALPATPAITVAAIPIDSDPERQRMTEIVQKPPIDESRRLFQRLWTDEDEIELLRGFLDYTTSNRAGGGGGNLHHHDTTAFYEQIKSKLQLDFNKNQLVEKLRRLKKKYRNAVNKINSGKDISFKSPHEQATFEISRKIWSDTGKIIGFEDNMLDDDENQNHNNINTITTSTSGNFNLTHCSNPNFEVKIEDVVERKMGNSSSNRSRKRSRSKLGKIDEERRCASDGFGANINTNENSGGGSNDKNQGSGGGGGDVAAVVEETLKSCLSPLFREFMNGTTAATAMMIGGNPYVGSRGMGLWPPMASAASVLPPFPSHLPAFGFGGMLGLNNIGGHGHGDGGGGVGELVNEKWRKQQILELEVYSRRLELVQDQIRLALAELQAMGARGGG